MTRTDFQAIADVRAAEAKVLLTAKKWDGAYYLAGYAVECALKACIAKLTKADDFPDKDRASKAWTHRLDELLLLADLKSALDAEIGANPRFGTSWDTVKRWREASRYARTAEQDAREMLDAVTSRKHGVLPWIKRWW